VHSTRSSSSSSDGVDLSSVGWRASALSSFFSHIPLEDEDTPTDSGPQRTIPKLAQLCMRSVLPYCRGSLFAEVLVPCLHPHLRRDLLRWTAIHAPLSSSKLFALCDNDKHVDGELIVVGLQASLPIDYFKQPDRQYAQELEDGGIRNETGDSSEDSGTSSWESSTSSGSTPPATFTTLVLVTTPLPLQLLFTLPPSLTHLALLALPAPTPIHRLPRICPLLEVLDLSYNPWLGYLQLVGADAAALSKDQFSAAGNETIVERVEWGRWRQLRVLRLSNCGVGESIIQKVNKGRWVDVEVFGVHD